MFVQWASCWQHEPKTYLGRDRTTIFPGWTRLHNGQNKADKFAECDITADCDLAFVTRSLTYPWLHVYHLCPFSGNCCTVDPLAGTAMTFIRLKVLFMLTVKTTLSRQTMPVVSVGGQPLFEMSTKWSISLAVCWDHSSQHSYSRHRLFFHMVLTVCFLH